MTAEHAKTSTEAKARGLSIYFTGYPCEHGHIAPRWAISKQCTVCQAPIKMGRLPGIVLSQQPRQ